MLNTNKYSSEFLDLLLRRLKGEISPLEEEVFQNWLQNDKNNAELFARLQNEEDLKNKIDFFAGIDPDKNWDRFVERANSKKQITFWSRSRELLKYAAIILIVFLGGATLYTLKITPDKKEVTASRAIIKTPDVVPGSNKATLTLSNGTIVSLNETADGVLRETRGGRIIKRGDKVIYEFSMHKGPKGNIETNTISTPRGGKYQIVLPDGTQAWLNAASSITFPTSFLEDRRQIEIEGEVFLEVTKDKRKPFFVNINGKSSVQVLGTTFNINSYPNEGNITTTLVEGSIKINNQLFLRPGQQAVQPTAVTGASTNLQERITVTEADLEKALAWKNGWFNFNGASLYDVMRQLERWYDITVVYEGEIPPVTFMGKMDKGVTLSGMLNIFSNLNFKIKMRLEGKTLIVSGT